MPFRSPKTIPHCREAIGSHMKVFLFSLIGQHFWRGEHFPPVSDKPGPACSKKQENFCYVLINKSPYTLRSAIFMKFLKLAFIYILKAWHFALRDVFIYIKSLKLRKKARPFALDFYVKNPHILHYAIFHWIFGVGGGGEGGGGAFLHAKKQCTCVTFLYLKKMHFVLRFI